MVTGREYALLPRFVDIHGYMVLKYTGWVAISFVSFFLLR
jgi:hypothetical protein